MSSEDLSVRRKRVLRSKWPPSFQLVHLSYGGEGGIPRRLAMLVCFSVVAIAPPQMSDGRPPDARLSDICLLRVRIPLTSFSRCKQGPTIKVSPCFHVAEKERRHLRPDVFDVARIKFLKILNKDFRDSSDYLRRLKKYRFYHSLQQFSISCLQLSVLCRIWIRR